jgi:hypothetical protein
MIPLPRWAWPLLLNKTCPFCDSSTSLNHIMGVGIQEKEPSTLKNKKGNVFLTFIYSCPNCDQKSLWKADPQDSSMSAEDLSSNIKDSISSNLNKKANSNNTKVSKSKISNKEFEDFKKKLQKFESHEDFLNFIGVPKLPNNKKDKKTDGD